MAKEHIGGKSIRSGMVYKREMRVLDVNERLDFLIAESKIALFIKWEKQNAD